MLFAWRATLFGDTRPDDVARERRSSYHGIEGIREFLAEWLEVWGDFEIDVEEVLLAPDGRVVSLFTHHGRGHGSGVPMDLEMAHIATLRDGTVVAIENYDDRTKALEAAGLRE